MDSNTYYTCKCIYFDGGFITCRICSEWVYNTCDNNVKPEPVRVARRWSKARENNRNTLTSRCFEW